MFTVTDDRVYQNLTESNWFVKGHSRLPVTMRSTFFWKIQTFPKFYEFSICWSRNPKKYMGKFKQNSKLVPANINYSSPDHRTLEKALCIYSHSDASFPALVGIPAFMKSKFPHFYLFLVHIIWRLLVQIHALFQGFPPSDQLTSLLTLLTLILVSDSPHLGLHQDEVVIKFILYILLIVTANWHKSLLVFAVYTQHHVLFQIQ